MRRCVIWGLGWIAGAALALPLIATGSSPAGAQQAQNAAALRIAIMILAPEPSGTAAAQGLAEAIGHNLVRDPQLVLVDTPRGDASVDFDRKPEFDALRASRVDALVTGRVRQEADGRLVAEFRLWDIAAGVHVIGRQYRAGTDRQPQIAVEISNAIYERLTGKKNTFN